MDLSEKHVEAKLTFLAETDEKYSQLYAAKDAYKEKLKIHKAKAFLEATGTAGERQAKAECHPDVTKTVDEMENIIADFVLLQSQRKRAETVIDVWRSLNASRRKN